MRIVVLEETLLLLLFIIIVYQILINHNFINSSHASTNFYVNLIMEWIECERQ